MPAHSSPCPFISACRRPVLGGRAACSVRPSVAARASSSASSAFGLHPAPVASGSSLRPRSLAIRAAACRRGNTVIVTAALVRTYRAPPCTPSSHTLGASPAHQMHLLHVSMHVTSLHASAGLPALLHVAGKALRNRIMRCCTGTQPNSDDCMAGTCMARVVEGTGRGFRGMST